MSLFVEQALHACAACSQAFALQYRLESGEVARGDSRRLRKVWVACPGRACGRANPVLAPRLARNLLVKAIPGPDRSLRVPDASLQHLWARVSVAPAPGRRTRVAGARLLAMLQRWAAFLSYGWPLFAR